MQPEIMSQEREYEKEMEAQLRVRGVCSPCWTYSYFAFVTLRLNGTPLLLQTVKQVVSSDSFVFT